MDFYDLLGHSDSRQMRNVFSLLLGFSLLLLLDILLIIGASRLWGEYLVVALTAAASLLLLILSINTVSRLKKLTMKKIRRGIYPEREFMSAAGAVFAAVFFLFPGSITNIIGILLIFPPVRLLSGRIILRGKRSRLQEIYEYLKIQEFSRS